MPPRSRDQARSRAHSGARAAERRPVPPLDAAALDRLALRYVERFATTRGRLADYLRRKLRERGWADEAVPPEPEALAARMATLGYVDDRAYGEGKAAAMARRGLGAPRVGGALRAARLDADDLEAIAPEIAGRALDAALALARRRRIGPYAAELADRAMRERQLATMLRAGHDLSLSRRIVGAAPGDAIRDAAHRSGDCDADEPC